MLALVLVLLAAPAQGPSDPRKAAEEAQAQVDRAPQDGDAWYRLAMARLLSGQAQAAVAAFEKSWALGARPPGALYNQACAQARAGHAQRALELLDQVLAAGNMPITPAQLRSDEDLASLRAEAGFQALLAKAEKAAHPCDEGNARQFDFWLGEWVVRDPAGRQVGTSSVTKILGGCVLLEQWTDAAGGQGKSFNLWDPAQKRWRQTWVDDHARQTDYAGGREGEQMRFLAHSPGLDRRMTFTPLQGGRVRQQIEVSRDGGKQWTTGFDGLYSPRQGGGAAGGK